MKMGKEIRFVLKKISQRIGAFQNKKPLICNSSLPEMILSFEVLPNTKRSAIKTSNYLRISQPEKLIQPNARAMDYQTHQLKKMNECLKRSDGKVTTATLTTLNAAINQKQQPRSAAVKTSGRIQIKRKKLSGNSPKKHGKRPKQAKFGSLRTNMF